MRGGSQGSPSLSPSTRRHEPSPSTRRHRPVAVALSPSTRRRRPIAIDPSPSPRRHASSPPDPVAVVKAGTSGTHPDRLLFLHFSCGLEACRAGRYRATDREIDPDKPQETPMPSLLLLLPLLLAATTTNAKVTPPVPTPWPEQFHAVVFTNHTESGGRLQLIDLYYDWPRGRDLNVLRDQLSVEPLYNVEWTNGTSYLFDSASCRTMRFPVGLLPPDWLANGAVYLGREAADGFDCHVWTNFVFVRYYADVATGRPVRWNFNGMERHVMSFEEGGVLEDSSKWQAPAYCFNGGNADTANVAADGVDGEGSRADAMNSLIMFAGAPAAAASFDQ
ncbi:uncharacterized protein At4g14100-like [Phragmites australis]|uniref:uncharacterized protein At4g14100-like n=1 Tax=Phragmites australis TaxID=29695 RepID=UPI002D775450|nr:uncharacterized protein At4g14100-like [Phragmites australis]